MSLRVCDTPFGYAFSIEMGECLKEKCVAQGRIGAATKCGKGGTDRWIRDGLACGWLEDTF